MSSSINKSNRFPIYAILIVGIILCGIIATAAYKNMSVKEETKKYSYTPNTSVSYLVYYQDNEFYNDKQFYTKDDAPFLGSVVDKVSITFDYGQHFSDDVTGTYVTNVTGTLTAYDPGSNEKLWDRTYSLSDEIKESYGAKDFSVQKKVDIDYQTYLSEYKGYARMSKVSSNAKFVVTFEVVNKAKYNSLPESETKHYYSVIIPLTDTTFKLKETTNVKTEEVIIKNTNDKSNDEKFVCYIIIALCIVLAVVLLTFGIIVYRNDIKRESLYNRTLKKLITTYDNILVSVQKLPDTKGLNIVNVTAFDDLVDAQSEVRLPINYKEDTKKKTTKFILIRNDMAWVYTLKEGDLEDEKKA